MGEEAPADQALKEQGDTDSDVSSDEDMTNEIANTKGKEEDVDSEEDLDDEVEPISKSGNDALNSNAFDIPTANDIPIISKLAKQTEKEKLANMDGQQQLEYHKKKKQEVVDKAIEQDDENYETHFVENPFIKIRERAAQKNRDSKVMMGEEDLQMQAKQAAENDVYIMEDSGKMYVQDLEKAQNDKNAKAKKRSKEGYGVDSDTDSDDDAAIVKKGSSSRQIKNALKKHNLTTRNQGSSGIQKHKSLIQKARHRAAAANSGHIEKFSGDAYKSSKGKGDVIKAGKLEPFSYI